MGDAAPADTSCLLATWQHWRHDCHLVIL